MDSQVNYEAVLNDLRAKRAALDSTIAGLEQVLGLTSSGALATAGGTVNIREDEFHGLSIVDATKKFLQMSGKSRGPKSTQEVAEGLKRGACDSEVSSVNATLNRRNNNERDIIKVNGKWALPEWYPSSGRPRKKVRNADGSESEVEENGMGETATAGADSQA